MSWPFEYRGNLEWLRDGTILLVNHGSRAYGTHLPTSDHDYKGVAVSPLSYHIGFLNRFEQAEIRDPDAVIYELSKFIKLAADCNPSILEALFVSDEDVLICTWHGEKLREHRQAFLSQKALHTFTGYAIQQLRRIERHRGWLLNPPKKKPERADFGLPEHPQIPTAQVKAAMSAIQTKIDGWAIDYGDMPAPSKIYIRDQIADFLTEVKLGSEESLFESAARLTGLEKGFIEHLSRERRYEAARRHWRSYEEWKRNRNPLRAESEEKFGYDTKHAMHLVRLMRMCREILQEGEVKVKRPDAEELLSIRRGAWTFEQLKEWATAEDGSLRLAVKTSSLPKKPDRVFLDSLCVEIAESFYGS